jgi:hypothetical protein
MSSKIPKEKLLDLYERSSCGMLRPEECAVWMASVCKYTLELLKEKEAREQAMDLIRRIDEFKKAKQK